MRSAELHLGWVREGTEFTIRLFLDAVPRAELGPLVWLATQPGCPLRLGAGKPLGFGAVTISIDWPAAELRTGQALRGCWVDLARLHPVGHEQIETLAPEFEDLATSHPVLAPAVAAWRKVAQGLDVPIHYPRTRKEPRPKPTAGSSPTSRSSTGNLNTASPCPTPSKTTSDSPSCHPPAITPDTRPPQA